MKAGNAILLLVAVLHAACGGTAPIVSPAAPMPTVSPMHTVTPVPGVTRGTAPSSAIHLGWICKSDGNWVADLASDAGGAI